MLQLQFPTPDFRIRTVKEKDEIFDTLRKKWLVLTPEEWVRQNLVRWLTDVHGIPGSFIALERSVMLGERQRRFDLVVYNRKMQPWLLAECKAMDVPLNERVLRQALSYVSVLGSGIMLISNGQFTYAWKLKGNEFQMLEKLPGWV